MSTKYPTAKRLMDTVSDAHRMSYRIGRSEQGVLTFEPYKSAILPLWRFRTVPIAQKSAEDPWEKFKEFKDQDDFVGMDMTRKFIQMDMTRAKRYANHAGGRKYKKGTKEELSRRDKNPDRDDKERPTDDYQNLKRGFLKQQKQWNDS
ncbi:hypothetical protein BKA56DRAFT_638810 [Ilyonectria sp. MPI-CAGE-AT-0026]|nr:hypothetical protein BKA56DRAFT_638810 [Ilyonectria sp. MPI-CAGE-AT-0026]